MSADAEWRASRCLLVLCGLPAAGKTTLAHGLCTRHPTVGRDEPEIVHICFDAALDDQTDGFDPIAWQAGRQSMLDRIERSLARHVQQPGAAPLLLVVDDNMYYRSMRYEVYKAARRHEAAYVQCFISCSPERAAARNAGRRAAQRVPPHVVQRMEQALEPPDSSHSFERNSIVIDSTQEMDAAALAAAAQWMHERVLALWGAPEPQPTSAGAPPCPKT